MAGQRGSGTISSFISICGEMRKMKAILQLVISMFLMLRACSFSSASLIDIDLFDNKACIQPCWEGLSPGADEAATKAVFTEFVPSFHRSVVEEYVDYAGQSSGDYSVDAYLTDDRVVGIALYAPWGFNLTLGTIIEELGNPAYVYVRYHLTDMSDDIYPFVELYYPDDGYAFYAPLDIHSISDTQIELCLDQGITVSKIYLVFPGSIEQVLFDKGQAVIPGITLEEALRMVERFTGWNGYSCVKLAYSPDLRLVPEP
jgi:hypothetical protein